MDFNIEEEYLNFTNETPDSKSPLGMRIDLGKKVGFKVKAVKWWVAFWIPIVELFCDSAKLLNHVLTTIGFKLWPPEEKLIPLWYVRFCRPVKKFHYKATSNIGFFYAGHVTKWLVVVTMVCVGTTYLSLMVVVFVCSLVIERI